MKYKEIKKTSDGLCYMNIGCGNAVNSEWNNLDFRKSDGVVFYDARDPLPYENNSFDFIYSSHLLEHLTLKESEKLVREIFRVLKTGGVVRIVVPDLEKICSEYLKYLELSEKTPTEQNIRRYNWIKIELLDQMTRTKRGGLMREVLDSQDVDEEYLKERIGDAAISSLKKKSVAGDSTPKMILKKIFGKLISKIREINSDPRKTGEVHKWMYDEFSLKMLLEAAGFKNAKVVKFNESSIKHWDKYSLDKSKFDAGKPRKPESIFVEAKKI